MGVFLTVCNFSSSNLTKTGDLPHRSHLLAFWPLLQRVAVSQRRDKNNWLLSGHMLKVWCEFWISLHYLQISTSDFFCYLENSLSFHSLRQPTKCQEFALIMGMYYAKILHCTCESDSFQGSLRLFLFCGHISSATITGTQAHCHVLFIGKVSPLVACSRSWQESYSL